MGIPRVRKTNFHDLTHAIDAVLVSDGSHDFHPVFKVPPHPIGTAQVPHPLGGVRLPSREVKNSRVFKEPANHTHDGDVVAESGYTGAKQAEPADDQLYLDPSSRSAVESLDDLRVLKLIHFAPDSGRLSVGGMLCFFVDQTKEGGLHGLWRQQDVVESLLS